VLIWLILLIPWTNVTTPYKKKKKGKTKPKKTKTQKSTLENQKNYKLERSKEQAEIYN